MKDYRKTDYALNKKSDSILYRTAKGDIIKIDFTKISQNDPNFTLENFEILKQLSDEIYLKQARLEHQENDHKAVIFDHEEYNASISTFCLEETFFTKEYISLIFKTMDQCLTETQKRRFILNRIEGISETKIAQMEGVSQNVVWKSIMLAEKKLKKFLK